MEQLTLERYINDNLFDFIDGYLGSTGHGAPYYMDGSPDEMDEIERDERSKLMSLTLNKEFFEDDDEKRDNWSEYWKVLSGYDSTPIEDVLQDDGYGYGWIEVDREKEAVHIYVVPCLYTHTDEHLKVFGFADNGTLVRLIPRDQLEKLLEDDENYVG